MRIVLIMLTNMESIFSKASCGNILSKNLKISSAEVKKVTVTYYEFHYSNYITDLHLFIQFNNYIDNTGHYCEHTHVAVKYNRE